jgi:hypothetical protein
LSLLGFKFHPELSEITLTFVGRCDRLLEIDDRNLGAGSDCRSGGKTGR